VIDTRNASEELADAISTDLMYLQPADEQRFEPVTIAVVVGLWVLRAVADGIRDGIKEAAADETKKALPTVAKKVKTILPQWLRRAFSRSEAGPPSDEDHAETQDALAAAKDAAVKLNVELYRQLPEVVSAAVRETLASEGLPDRAASRVEQVLRVQVEMAIT
jgi:hypothetical protein